MKISYNVFVKDKLCSLMEFVNHVDLIRFMIMLLRDVNVLVQHSKLMMEAAFDAHLRWHTLTENANAYLITLNRVLGCVRGVLGTQMAQNAEKISKSSKIHDIN